MVRLAKSLAQLKRDAENSDYGLWQRHWDRDPTDWHPNDERALMEGCWFDVLAANRIYDFFEKRLTLPASRSARYPRGVRPFSLMGWWYRDVLGPIFGWKRADGRRRFDRAFITTGKKSGKSTVLSGLPAYMITADGEEEAEAYSTATDRDQAAIIFRKAARMVRKSPWLDKRLKITESRNRIYDERTGSWYEAVASDADSIDGAHPHLMICDELHRWKDRGFFEALMYGDVRREQALFLMITTAGLDTTSLGFEEYELARALLDPNDPTYVDRYFSFIAEAPRATAWDDPEGWIAANPAIAEPLLDVLPHAAAFAKHNIPLQDERGGRRRRWDLLQDITHVLQPLRPERRGAVLSELGVDQESFEFSMRFMGKLQSRCDAAKAKPNDKRKFMRYICNWWVEDSVDTFIDPEIWKRGKRIVEPARRAPCGLGLDLSSSIDITAACKAIPHRTTSGGRMREGFWLEWQFWMPADTLLEAMERDKVPYQQWADDGFIELTPGSRIKQSYVRRWITGITLDETGAVMESTWMGAVIFERPIKAICYDRWSAEGLISQLADNDGLTMIEFGQGYKDMSPGCKRLRELAVDHSLWHYNPVADWMNGGCKSVSDAADNIKLDKKKSRRRIDGMTAAVMAIAAHERGVESGAWSGEPGTGTWDD